MNESKIKDLKAEALGILREAGYAVSIIDPKVLGETGVFEAEQAMKAAAYKEIDRQYADNPDERPRRWGNKGWE